MADKGMLDAYVGKDVNLIMDLGDISLRGGQNPIKVSGNLAIPINCPVNEYRLLISDWDASIKFTVVEAMVKLVLSEGGEVEDITITVLPKEIF